MANAAFVFLRCGRCGWSGEQHVRRHEAYPLGAKDFAEQICPSCEYRSARLSTRPYALNFNDRRFLREKGIAANEGAIEAGT